MPSVIKNLSGFLWLAVPIGERNFFEWNVKNISKSRQMLTCHGLKMPDIPNEPLNQEVFYNMIDFLTAVSKKAAITEKLENFVSFFCYFELKTSMFLLLNTWTTNCYSCEKFKMSFHT